MHYSLLTTKTVTRVNILPNKTTHHHPTDLNYSSQRPRCRYKIQRTHYIQTCILYHTEVIMHINHQ